MVLIHILKLISQPFLSAVSAAFTRAERCLSKLRMGNNSLPILGVIDLCFRKKIRRLGVSRALLEGAENLAK